jgi:PAS domain S-box-containing protein
VFVSLSCVCGQCFTICSAHDPERRITFASDGFLKMTGYTNEQVIGKPALFLVVSPTHEPQAVVCLSVGQIG